MRSCGFQAAAVFSMLPSTVRGAAGKMLVSEYARHSLALSSVQLSLVGECGTSVLFVFNGLLPSPCIFKTEQPSTCIANDLFCYNPS